MKIKNATLPLDKVVLSTLDGRTTVTLWNGEYEEDLVPQNAVMDTGETDECVIEYTYDIYQIMTTPRPTLKKDIEKSFDTWYTAAKKKEENALLCAELAKFEQEILGNLEATLLDYDYRLMMLEEFGGMM